MVLLKIENKSSAVRLIKELRQTNWKRLQNEENLVFFFLKKEKNLENKRETKYK